MALPAALLAMDRPGDQDLVIVRGDDRAIPLDLLNDDGSPLDLTGCTMSAAVYASPGGAKVCDLAVGVVSLALGQLTIGYTHTVSGGLTASDSSQNSPLGIWYLKATAGTDVATVLTGSVTLIRPQ